MQIHISEDFQNICELIIKKSFIFSIYSLPEENTIYLIFQKSDKPVIINNLMDQSGFVIIPYNSNSGKYLIVPDYKITNFDKIEKNIINDLKNIKDKPYVSQYTDPKSISQDQFINKVIQIKNLIEKENIKKIVLSRVEKSTTNKEFSLFNLFLKLKESYPHAFIFLFSIKPNEYWIGSSPEPFLIINKDESMTFSIAGTQKIINDEHINWSIKDLQEQQIVSEFIEEILTKELKFKISKKGPFTFNAGNLVHLKTIFYIKENNIHSKIDEIIEKLYPTPSTAGYPKEKAIELINQIEEYNRDLYTGIIGPIDLKNKISNLFVNLRCMKKFENNIWFFQGAGIVNDSVPEKEWEETENKKMTLYNILIKMLKNE